MTKGGLTTPGSSEKSASEPYAYIWQVLGTKTNVRPRNSSASLLDCESFPANFVVACRYFDTRFCSISRHVRRLHISPSFRSDCQSDDQSDLNARPRSRLHSNFYLFINFVHPHQFSLLRPVQPPTLNGLPLGAPQSQRQRFSPTTSPPPPHLYPLEK